MKLRPIFMLTWKGIGWGIPGRGHKELTMKIYSIRWWPW